MQSGIQKLVLHVVCTLANVLNRALLARLVHNSFVNNAKDNNRQNKHVLDTSIGADCDQIMNVLTTHREPGCMRQSIKELSR